MRTHETECMKGYADDIPFRGDSLYLVHFFKWKT